MEEEVKKEEKRRKSAFEFLFEEGKGTQPGCRWICWLE
jgi:hypothetical protein